MMFESRRSAAIAGEQKSQCFHWLFARVVLACGAFTWMSDDIGTRLDVLSGGVVSKIEEGH